MIEMIHLLMILIFDITDFLYCFQFQLRTLFFTKLTLKLEAQSMAKELEEKGDNDSIIQDKSGSNAAEFVERIKDGQMEHKKKLYWDKHKIISLGWSGTCITSTNDDFVFIKINKICDEWSNEIHICSDKNWRKYQLFGFLDNGKLYSTYCKLYQKGLAKWNTVNSIVGVILDRKAKPITAKFYVNNQEQCKVELPNNTDPNKVVLSVRVHTNGSIESVPKFYQLQ